MDESPQTTAANQSADWAYNDSGPSGQSQQHIETISWTASEYISHEKSPAWYAAVSAGSTTVAAIIYIATRELLASITIVIVAFSAIFYAGRKPEIKQYELSDNDIAIDGKHYPLDGFRSFSVMEEGAITSIWLKPLKKFTPTIVVYFAPEDGESIVAALSNFLPYQEHQLDPVDKITKRIRF